MDFDLNRVDVINPDGDRLAKLKSQIFKRLKVKRNYHFYSKKRLSSVASKFDKATFAQEQVDAYFFHGFTPWILTKPTKPYYCFNDACFATYLKYYNNQNEFSVSNIERLFNLEKEWLTNATKVFFRSQWALDQAKKSYVISGDNFVNVGAAGFINIPDRDYYSEGLKFLFISREFIPKGGQQTVQAFKILKSKYPKIQLNIVGDAPANIKNLDVGINNIGFLNKNDDLQRKKLIDIFQSSFALVHPTRKDINPLVIIELAYYGCPAISSNAFAIPEYVLDGKTGFLLDDELDVNELVQKMESLIVNKDMYLKMRKLTRKNAILNNTWDKVGERIRNTIKASL